MKETNTQVINEKVKMNGSDILSFELEDKKYAKKLMNMENPKLSMDAYGEAIAETQFETARKNDIWKNNKGEQLKNVELKTKKRKHLSR